MQVPVVPRPAAGEDLVLGQVGPFRHAALNHPSLDSSDLCVPLVMST